jgi:hypothetical protein
MMYSAFYLSIGTPPPRGWIFFLCLFFYHGEHAIGDFSILF